MTTPASQVLREALALLGENGEHWKAGDGMRSPERPAYCAVSCITRVSPGDNLVAEHVAVQAMKSIVGPVIWKWNDAPGRTFAEVRAAFLRAIALAEGEEG